VVSTEEILDRAIRRAPSQSLVSFRHLSGLVTARRETPRERNAPKNSDDRIGFCLRAVHQKFTIVHSPNTLPRTIPNFWPDLQRHGGCSSAARLVSSAFI